jgi:hypothetical protein
MEQNTPGQQDSLFKQLDKETSVLGAVHSGNTTWLLVCSFVFVLVVLGFAFKASSHTPSPDKGAHT